MPTQIQIDTLRKLAGLETADVIATEQPTAPIHDISIGPESDNLADIMPKMWAVFGRTYSPCEKVATELPAGHYMFKASADRGIYIAEKGVNLDDLLILPDSATDEVVYHIEKFWTKEQHYRDFGFLWKRGVLLIGPPGSGKTSAVQLISQKIVDRNGLVFYVNNPSMALQGLDMLRFIEPNRPIVVVLEDIDATIDRYGEQELLSLLDGEFQIDNAVYIATTNYPEKLDKRITNRPSRFDVVVEIGMPSAEARRKYLESKNPRLKDTEEMGRWVSSTDGFSIAHLKELITGVECLELSFEDVVKRLREMINAELSSTKTNESGSQFGFNTVTSAGRTANGLLRKRV